MSRNKQNQRRGCWAGCLTGAALMLLGSILVDFILLRPDLAAQGADILRAMLGDRAVANLEMALFQAQDAGQKLRYTLGMATPAPPWQVEADTLPTVVSAVTLPPTTAPIQKTQSSEPLPLLKQPKAKPTFTTTPTYAPTFTPTPEIWQPAPVTALGALEGEGTWSPYLHSGGQTVAYRTYLQPDPTRPFAVLAVIAIDLDHTRLHFILGFEEPYAPGGPVRTGAMPIEDKVSGRLLAMFNGGFKATHGHFGAMADGITALPPRSGLGTLIIDQDGRVRLGVWGSSIQPSPEMECWRQNGPLVIEDGQINPHIYNNSPKDWGYTVNDVSPTWRSAVGLSADGRVLYYLAGSSLSMEALAKGMLAAGVEQGMQLDINTYWVHFVAVHDQDGQRVLEPLFPQMMKENIDRYLYQYSRDYFYVTAQ